MTGEPRQPECADDMTDEDCADAWAEYERRYTEYLDYLEMRDEERKEATE